MQDSSFAPCEWRKGDYILSTDPARLDLDAIHAFLSGESYWAKGLPRDVLARALAHSLPFGIYTEAWEQIGFGRVVTDYALFAYLRDVYVLDTHRGRGLAGWLAEVSREHPALASITTWTLATADAHGVYERAGYQRAEHPEWYMQVKREGWKAD